MLINIIYKLNQYTEKALKPNFRNSTKINNKENLFCDSQFDRKKAKDNLKSLPTNFLLFVFPIQAQEIYIIN